jgi:hypothetical protein
MCCQVKVYIYCLVFLCYVMFFMFRIFKGSSVERIKNHFSTYWDHLDEIGNYCGAFINVL